MVKEVHSSGDTKNMSKIALITGATSGIGRATAKLFAKNNFNLILCGRRQKRLNELQKELGILTKVHTLNFDIRNKEDVSQQIIHCLLNFRILIFW